MKLEAILNIAKTAVKFSNDGIFLLFKTDFTDANG